MRFILVLLYLPSIPKHSYEGVTKTGLLKNFAKFTRKHLFIDEETPA